MSTSTMLLCFASGVPYGFRDRQRFELVPKITTTKMCSCLAWDSFAAAGCCAGHGVSAAVCAIGLQLLLVALFQRCDLRENFQIKTNSLLNRFWSCQGRLTLLNRYFLINNVF